MARSLATETSRCSTAGATRLITRRPASISGPNRYLKSMAVVAKLEGMGERARASRGKTFAVRRATDTGPIRMRGAAWAAEGATAIATGMTVTMSAWLVRPRGTEPGIVTKEGDMGATGTTTAATGGLLLAVAEGMAEEGTAVAVMAAVMAAEGPIADTVMVLREGTTTGEATMLARRVDTRIVGTVVVVVVMVVMMAVGHPAAATVSTPRVVVLLPTTGEVATSPPRASETRTLLCAPASSGSQIVQARGWSHICYEGTRGLDLLQSMSSPCVLAAGWHVDGHEVVFYL